MEHSVALPHVRFSPTPSQGDIQAAVPVPPVPDLTLLSPHVQCLHCPPLGHDLAELWLAPNFELAWITHPNTLATHNVAWPCKAPDAPAIHDLAWPGMALHGYAPTCTRN